MANACRASVAKDQQGDYLEEKLRWIEDIIKLYMRRELGLLAGFTAFP
jgi:hypothetical protein